MSQQHDMGYMASQSRLRQVESKTFLALTTSNTIDDDFKEKFYKASPSIISSGSNLLLDFSNSRFENEFSKIVELFSIKGSGNFTLSNAKYSNEIYGIESNFEGTYNYVKTIGKDKILVTPPAGVTWNQKQKIYKSEYFGSQFLFGITLPNNPEKNYKIINNLGFLSRESFARLGVEAGDYLKISSSNSSINGNRLYKVLRTSTGIDNEEIITLNREIPELDLTGVPTVITLFKDRDYEKNLGTNCFYAKETTFDPVRYQYYEVGQLVECNTGFVSWGKREASAKNYDHLFAPLKANLSSNQFNATECTTCPQSYLGEVVPLRDEEAELADNLRKVSIELTRFENEELKRKSRENFISGDGTARTREIFNRTNINFSSADEFKEYTQTYNAITPTSNSNNISGTYNVSFENGAVFIDGVKNKILDLVAGQTYKFNVENSSLSSNSSGPYAVYGTDIRTGRKGYYYPLYTRRRDNSHNHVFIEYPGRTFYMPNAYVPETNHAQRTRGGYALYDGSAGSTDKIMRIGFSFTSGGSNSGGSDIVTGVQRVGRSGFAGSYVLITIPRNREKLFYFVEGVQAAGGLINVRQDATPINVASGVVRETVQQSSITPVRVDRPVSPPPPPPQTQRVRAASPPPAPMRSMSPPPAPPSPPSGGGGGGSYGY
jgi:hypothetical protein